MAVRLVTCDCTVGSSKQIEDPTCKSAKAEILQMDGQQHSSAGMMVDDDHPMLIGGGRYVVSVRDGDRLCTLKNPQGSGDLSCTLAWSLINKRANHHKKCLCDVTCAPFVAKAVLSLRGRSCSPFAQPSDGTTGVAAHQGESQRGGVCQQGQLICVARFMYAFRSIWHMRQSSCVVACRGVLVPVIQQIRKMLTWQRYLCICVKTNRRGVAGGRSSSLRAA